MATEVGNGRHLGPPRAASSAASAIRATIRKAPVQRRNNSSIERSIDMKRKGQDAGEAGAWLLHLLTGSLSQQEDFVVGAAMRGRRFLLPRKVCSKVMRKVCSNAGEG